MIKRIFMLFSFMLLFMAITCDNEPYEGNFINDNNACLLATEASSEVLENLNNSSDDDYNLFCQVYRDALEDQIIACGDENNVLQGIIDDLEDCTPAIDISLCEMAIEATAMALSDFEDAITIEFQNYLDLNNKLNQHIFATIAFHIRFG